MMYIYLNVLEDQLFHVVRVNLSLSGFKVGKDGVGILPALAITSLFSWQRAFPITLEHHI